MSGASREEGSYSGKRVLIFGGLGFIGLNLTRALLDGGANVRIVSRSAPPLALDWLAGVAADRVVEFIHGDLAATSQNPDWLSGCELVINLAGESGASRSLETAREDMQGNIAGPISLLETVRHMARRPRVLFVSSRLVYGITGSEPVSESHATLPTSIYGLHKLAVEHYLRLYQHHFDVPYTAVRLTNPYGPFQLPSRSGYGVVNLFVMRALQGRALRLYGGGLQLRDYIHVHDVAEGLLTIGASSSTMNRCFNLGLGRSVSLATMAREVVSAAGSGTVEEADWPQADRRVETGDFLCNIDSLKSAIGWEPKIDIVAGIEATVEAYRRDLPAEFLRAEHPA